MIHLVPKPSCHKPQWGTKAGIENSCLVDSTNLVGSSGRDILRKSGAGGTPAEHFLRVHTITENLNPGKTSQVL